MRPYTILLILVCFSCGVKKSNQEKAEPEIPVQGTFGYDLDFISKYKDVIVLGGKASSAKVLLVKDYQGRVMTSTANGTTGNSYGWINYNLIQSGETKQHMNPYGGEDRFWLGPEGGQYALYFKKGDPFDFDHWQTPTLIDIEHFEIMTSDSTHAVFRKSAGIVNYQGFQFVIDIQREVKLLSDEDIQLAFGVSIGNLKAVSFQSTNSITNAGQEDWTRKNGLVSIWILGMFNPSDRTVIALPHLGTGDSKEITDNYFGSIPSDRIVKNDSLLLLKADGKYRGKVGIAPSIAKNIVGSYDDEKHILTLVKFDLDSKGAYVNSKWETQKEPFRGDAVNSYNDGPVADGSQLGPFYELESSSPAVALKKGETLVHHSTTLHLEGDEMELNLVAEKILGISLKEMRSFNK